MIQTSKILRISLIIGLTLLIQSCGLFKRGVPKDYAIEVIERIDSNYAAPYPQGEILSRRKTMKIAKDAVFNRFGYWHVNINERPFKKHFIGNYLYLAGTLSKRKSGGSFWVIIDRKNGEILTLSHGK